MTPQIQAIAVLAALLFIAASSVGSLFFLKWLAKENILFTTVHEGTAKAIMLGDSFDRFIMSFEKYHLNVPGGPEYRSDKPDWEVLYHGPDNEDGFPTDDAHYDRRNWLLKQLGLYWVGWPWAARVYVYPFEWNETRTDKSGSEQVLPRAEATDFVYISDFTYAFVTEDAETGQGQNLPVTVLSLATIAIRNPYRALFSGMDWMRRVTGAINRNARDFVGIQTYEDIIGSLVGKDEKPSETAFSKPIIELTRKLPDDDGSGLKGLHGRYGVVIRTADLQNVDLSGDGKAQNQAAATRKYAAEKEALAITITGKAEANVIKIKGTAEAKSLGKRLAVITSAGEAGIRLAQFDAMQGSANGKGNTVVWGVPQQGLVPTMPVQGMKEKDETGGAS